MKTKFAFLFFGLFFANVWFSFDNEYYYKFAFKIASKWIITNNWVNISSYRLEDSITRKEMMKIVMNLSWEKVNSSCKFKFKDVENDWWCKYIETALEKGFIAQNENFRPNDNITKSEAMKLILKSKWIEKVQNTDDRRKDYMQTAYKYSIISKKYADYDWISFRWWIFEISSNSIDYNEKNK